MTIPTCDWSEPTVERLPKPSHVRRTAPTPRTPNAIDSDASGIVTTVMAVAIGAGLIAGFGAVLVASMAQPILLGLLVVPGWLVWRAMDDVRGK